MSRQRFSFCHKCGGRLSYRFAGGRERLVCSQCSSIIYENPIVGVAAIVRSDGCILLGRRSSGSSYPGMWCIPCGYVEYDEDVHDAVRREFLEETGLIIKLSGVYTVLSNFHNPAVHTVGIWFDAQVIGGTLQPGDDLDAVEYFSLDDVPELAFPTDAQVITMLKSKNNIP